MGRNGWGDLAIRMATTLALCAALVWLSSCNLNGTRESDQQIQQQAQQATEQAKITARKAAADARVAAANAERDAHDIAKGVRAGLHNGTDAGVIDINSASRAQLESLPGVTVTAAKRIVEHRPYRAPRDLVRKGAVSEDEYTRIAGKVVVR